MIRNIDMFCPLNKLLHVFLTFVHSFQMKRVEEVLKRDPGKAWFVQIQPPSFEADKEFLLDFNVVDLCTQDKQQSFLKDLLARLGIPGPTQASAGQAGGGTDPTSAPQLDPSAQDAQRSAEAEKDFQPFPTYVTEIFQLFTFKFHRLDLEIECNAYSVMFLFLMS